MIRTGVIAGAFLGLSSLTACTAAPPPAAAECRSLPVEAFYVDPLFDLNKNQGEKTAMACNRQLARCTTVVDPRDSGATRGVVDEWAGCLKKWVPPGRFSEYLIGMPSEVREWAEAAEPAPD